MTLGIVVYVDGERVHMKLIVHFLVASMTYDELAVKIADILKWDWAVIGNWEVHYWDLVPMETWHLWHIGNRQYKLALRGPTGVEEEVHILKRDCLTGELSTN